MRFGLFSNHVRSGLGGADITANEDINSKWDEDIHEIVLADRLGYEDAWISEHTSFWVHPDALPSAELLIAKLSALTTQIRMGPAVRRIALMHPAQLAIETAVCDHLTGGRYMLGFGHGGPITGYEQRGIKLDDSHSMMLENIDLAVRMMTEDEPFDYMGQHYHGEHIGIYPKPLQKPHPFIAMASNQPENARWAAARDFGFLFSQTARPARSKVLGDAYAESSMELGRDSERSKLVATRTIYVADSDQKAVDAFGEDLWKLARQNIEWGKGGAEFFKGKSSRSPLYDEWVPDGGTLDDITLEYLIDEGMFIVGSPDTVEARCREFYHQCGGFGTLLLVMGKDIGDMSDREHSLELFAHEVAPRLRDLDPDRQPVDGSPVITTPVEPGHPGDLPFGSDPEHSERPAAAPSTAAH